MFLRFRDLALLAAFVVGFHLTGTALVRYYYSYFIAHYDSVGGLLQGVDTLEVYHDQGYWAAVQHGWDLAPLSITQNLFAALFAPFIDATPQGLQTYNTAAAAIAMLGVTVLMRCAGALLPAVALGLAGLFVGDALYWWDLGAFDYRRDFAMVALMSGALFLGAAVFAYRHSLAREISFAVMFGVVAGLTLISRDSAALMMTVVLIVPMAALAGYGGVKDGWMPQVRKIGWSLLGFAPFAAVFFIKVGLILDRLLNPLISYGSDPDQTLVATAHRVPDVILGESHYPFNTTPWITPLLVLALMAAIGFLWREARRKPEDAPAAKRSAENRRVVIFLTATAVWIPVSLHILLSVGVKLSAHHSFIAGIAAYLPVLVGLSSALVAAFIFLQGQFATRAGSLIACLLIGAIIISIPARAMSRLMGYLPGTYQTHEKMAQLFGTSETSPVIAVLSQRTELFRVPAIELMAKMKGLSPPRLLYYQPEGEAGMDFQIGIPPQEERQRRILAGMDRALRCDADFIVVEITPGSYSGTGSNLLLYTKGEDMISHLLADLADRPRRPLAPDGSVVLIDNKSRTACTSAPK